MRAQSLSLSCICWTRSVSFYIFLCLLINQWSSYHRFFFVMHSDRLGSITKMSYDITWYHDYRLMSKSWRTFDIVIITLMIHRTYFCHICPEMLMGRCLLSSIIHHDGIDEMHYAYTVHDIRLSITPLLKTRNYSCFQKAFRCANLFKQGKSEGFDSYDRPSNLTQIGLKS